MRNPQTRDGHVEAEAAVSKDQPEFGLQRRYGLVALRNSEHQVPQRSSVGSEMTVFEQVRSFIARLAPDAVCDDCIAEKLDLSVRQHANHKTRELSRTAGFERSRGQCSLCQSEKLVTRSTKQAG